MTSRIFAPPITNAGYRPSDPEDALRGVYFDEGYRGNEMAARPWDSFEEDANKREWAQNNGPLADVITSNALQRRLYKKQQDATQKARIADTNEKLRLFDSMTPEQTARVYSGAPQSEDEARLQKVIQDYQTGGQLGFAIGYKSQLANEKKAQQDALFNRQIRDSDLRYQLSQDAAQRANNQADIQSQGLGIRQQREDRLASNQDSAQHRKVINDAINAVASGAVHPDDVAQLFPELDESDLPLVQQYGRQAQSSSDADRRVSQTAADSYNKRLDDALTFFQRPENQGRSMKDKQAAINAVMSDYGKDKMNRGLIQYDPSMRTFVPVTEPATNRLGVQSQSPSLFYKPSVLGASPNNPIPQQGVGGYGPQPPQSPLDYAFNLMSGAGADSYGQQDPVLQTLNKRGLTAPIGARVQRDGVTYVKARDGWHRL